MKLACRFLVLASLFGAVSITAAQDRVPNVPGIDTSGMDLSVRPQDDFFRYVNGKWVDNTAIPGDLSAYGTFAILHDRAQENVRAIIEKKDASRRPRAPTARRSGICTRRSWTRRRSNRSA